MRQMPMNSADSDALVVFGITGDLSFKQIIPAIAQLVRRDRVQGPLIGVARDTWNGERLTNRVCESL